MAFGIGLRLSCLACFVVALAAEYHGPQKVFFVKKYGAVADGKTDDKQAFLNAWKDACAFKGKATLNIQEGTYLLGPIVFQGPCPDNVGTVVEVKGTLKASTNIYDYKDYGWIEFNKLHALVLRGGGTLDGQGSQTWQYKDNCPDHVNCRNLPTSLRINGVDNAMVSHLHLVDSKGFHMNFHQGANIHANRLVITAPRDSPNTDGIHISSVNNINITNTVIGTGDDCISMGPGATNVMVRNVTCGPGHGISVGSLGKYQNEKDVMGVKVKNCTLRGTTNGLRVKTWPGSQASKAQNLWFENIVMDNVSNPIIIDQEYCPSSSCNKGAPSGVKIADVTFKHIRGTTNTPVAVNFACSEAVPCKDVKLQDIELADIKGIPTEAACYNIQASYLGSQKPAPCH